MAENPTTFENIRNMSETTTHIEGRVASLERGLSDLASNLNAFVNSSREDSKAHREEISKVYGALKELGSGFGGALEDVKKVLNERGRVTGSFVLMLITTGISFLAIVGGFVHFYVGSRIDSTKTAMDQARADAVTFRAIYDSGHSALGQKVDNVSSQLSAELVRSLSVDAAGEMQRKMNTLRLDNLEKHEYERDQQEIARLKALLQQPPK